MSKFEQQMQQMRSNPGFIAALDQSGGSTPGALRLYGVTEDAWSNDDQMYAIVHQMRTRIMTSPGFTGQKILAQSCSKIPWTGKSRISLLRTIFGT